MDVFVEEPDNETPVETSDIAAALDEGECEVAAVADSEGEARADASSKKAIADGSDILNRPKEGEKLWSAG